MQTEEMILVQDFCICHNIELSFIYSLKDAGLMEFYFEEEKIFLPTEKISELEKYTRLHYEMKINVEGLETISHLLQRINVMQEKIIQLNNRLSIYE